MVIWTGWGFLGFLLYLAGAVGALFGFGHVYGNNNFAIEHTWAALLTLFLPAWIVWEVGKRFNPPGKKVKVKFWGTEKICAPHTLYFIPMQYFGIFIACVLSLTFYLIIPCVRMAGDAAAENDTAEALAYAKTLQYPVADDAYHATTDTNNTSVMSYYSHHSVDDLAAFLKAEFAKLGVTEFKYSQRNSNTSDKGAIESYYLQISKWRGGNDLEVTVSATPFIKGTTVYFRDKRS